MERRRYSRTQFAQPVCLWSTEPGEPVGSLACDLSEGGLRTNVTHFVPLGSPCTVQVPLSWEETIECPGRVVWVQKLPHMERYQVGIQFDEESSVWKTRQQIRQRVKDLLSNPKNEA